MQNLAGFTDAITGAAISAATLTSLLNRQTGDPVLVTPRIYVVDTQMQKIPVVSQTVANMVTAATGLPADTSDISPLLRNPGLVVSHDSQQAVHRTVQFTSLDPALVTNPTSLSLTSTPFNPEQHFLHISYCMVWPTAAVEFFLGVFNMMLPEEQGTTGGLVYTWAGADLTTLVTEAAFISDYVVTRNYPASNQAGVPGYVGAVMDMLMVPGLPVGIQGGIGICPLNGNPDAGPAVPKARIDIPVASNRATPMDYLFPAGSSRLEAINQLLRACSMWPLAVNEQGVFYSRPVPQASAGMPLTTWDFSTVSGKGVLTGDGWTRQFSSQGQNGTPNVVRVVSSASGSTAQDLAAIGANTNPDSMVSVTNMKALDGGPRAITQLIRNDQLPDLASCQALVNLTLQQGASQVEKLTFNTWPIPIMQDNDLVTAQMVDRTGRVLVPSDPQHPFLLTAWSLDCSPKGRQSVTLQAIVAI